MDGTYQVHERKSRLARWAILGLLAGALALPGAVFAQAAPPAEPEEDELAEPAEPGPGPGNIPAEPQPPSAPLAAGPQQPPVAPAPVAPPAAPPSPFTLTVKGLISGSVFLQDVPFAGATGGAAIYGPNGTIKDDKWLLGGDVRQSRLNFSIKGPPVFGGAIPNGVIELDLRGGHTITSAPNTAVPVTPTAGMPPMAVGTTSVNIPQGSAWGDETLLPGLRVAYAELSWDGGLNIVRVGQFHNLLLPMIAASAIHTGTPLGYAAGQLGWRSPGITYLHRQQFGEDTFLDLGGQINRNSWIDNLPACNPQIPSLAPPACLPAGVSLGEASMLPQFEARVMLSGGKAPSPWLFYAPNVWQVYVVGHWDQKDISGIGASSVGGAKDTFSTLLTEVGFKLHLGPVLLAGNGWYGKNSGSVYGNLIQLQSLTPGVRDVNGFGGWVQLGFNITEKLTVWGFAGIDKPNRTDAIAAGFTRLQNLQLTGMLAYSDGPMVVAAEFFFVSTDSYTAANMTTGAGAMTTSASGMQPSVTLMYNF